MDSITTQIPLNTDIDAKQVKDTKRNRKTKVNFWSPNLGGVFILIP